MPFKDKEKLKIYNRDNMRKWRELHPVIHRCKKCNIIIKKYQKLCNKCRKITCLFCGKLFDRSWRSGKQLKRDCFCDKSCKASYDNKKRNWKESSREKLRQVMLKNWKLEKYKNVSSDARREKNRQNNTGSKSHFWIDGRTPLIRRLRNTSKMKKWINLVFRRDNFTCLLCNSRSGNGKTVYLEADHYPLGFSKLVRKYNINTFESGMNCSELWDISNGRTLCLDCHKKTDNFGSKARYNL